MDLQELSERSGINRRKLRYVLDNNLVPGLKIEIADSEIGRPRKFNWDVGFVIVCAAHLLVAGLSHDSIRLFLKGLVGLTIGKRSLLKCLFERHSDLSGSGPVQSYARWGDGVNMRVTFEALNFDTKWQVPSNPARLDSNYEPMVEIVLNLGQILDQVAPSNQNP